MKSFPLVILLLLGLVSFESNQSNSIRNLTSLHSEDSVNTDSLIQWEANRKLMWSDFLGKPERRSSFKATTSSKIGFDWDFFQDSVNVTVSTQFIRYSSWVAGDPTEKLLAHEQGHFDIAEIISRMIRRDLSKLVFSNAQITGKSVSAIYKKHTQSTWSSYDAYDKETKHGIDEKQQTRWELKIAAELKKLDKYVNPQVMIR